LGSLKLRNKTDLVQQVYCPVRKIWVAALPEERVRQRWIAHMVEELNFPLSSLGVEKGLQQLPHLTNEGKRLPNRRADLICFSAGTGIYAAYPLYPLLLMEFKAVKILPSMLSQVIGYNVHVRAYFIAVVNQEEAKVGWFDPSVGEYRFIDHLPSYSELKGKVIYGKAAF
jgi:hypothetical protein